MNFNKHYLKNKHAFLSASKHTWLNYDPDKLMDAYSKHLAVERGTELHDLAERHIRLGVLMPDTQETLNMYINDAIRFHMKPEQVLYFSDNCFGTADTICFRNNFLRIHDYKSGTNPASMDQLKIYAALFCLEYDIDPADIEIELRIYQLNNIEKCNPDNDEIMYIIDKIIYFDKLIQEMKEKEE